MGWFLADPRRRKISPYSTETVPEWVRRRDDEFTPESLQAAWEVDPADALCLARRARNFALPKDPDPYWADLYSKLAMKLAPADAEAAWRRAAVLALAGRGAEAAAVAGRAPGPPAGDGWAWEAKWEACLFLHRDADAAVARQSAGALAEKMWWCNRNSFNERVKEAEARAAGAPTTQPATEPAK